MRYGWMAAALAAGLLIGLALSRETTGQSATTGVSYEEYEGRNLAPEEAKKKLMNEPIAVKDLFGEEVTRLHTELTRKGITAQKYLVFRTQAGYGSDMLCVVPRTLKDSVEEVGKTLPGGKIFLYGQIKDRIGLTYVFVVDEAVRGWEPKPKPKSIVITLSTPDSPAKRTFRLAEPGQTYRVPSPYDGKPIHISYQF